MALGAIGIWRRHQQGTGGLEEIEALGYGALWIGGSPSLTDVRPFLEGTSTITVATGILNVWQHEPAAVAAGARRAGGGLSRAVPPRDRDRPSRGDQSVRQAAHDDARVLRRPGRRRRARPPGRAPGGGARPEDARPGGGALARHAPVPHHARAHAIRPRAGRSGRPRGAGAHRRGRAGRRARPRDRARVRGGIPRPEELRVEPPALWLPSATWPAAAATGSSTR